MPVKKFLAETIFWFHFIMVLFWYGLFLVPLSWWQDKITFHFYFTVAIVAHQFLWGALILPWTKKYRMVCLLTTFMQLLRGQRIDDPKNYEFSFTREFLERAGIAIPKRAPTIITLTILILVTIQYIIFKS